MAECIKTIELKDGKGCIKYRLPNVIEQLRFLSESGWAKNEEGSDIYLKTLNAFEIGKKFIVSVEGAIDSLEALLDDRENLSVITEFVWDLAAAKLIESKKKP
jgi:hypothetical protein